MALAEWPFLVWFSMYRGIVAEETLPAVAHRYDRVHRLSSLRSSAFIPQHIGPIGRKRRSRKENARSCRRERARLRCLRSAIQSQARGSIATGFGLDCSYDPAARADAAFFAF
jgi:hypothetical protein